MCEIISLQDIASISCNPLLWMPMLKYCTVKIKALNSVSEHYHIDTFYFKIEETGK